MTQRTNDDHSVEVYDAPNTTKRSVPVQTQPVTTQLHDIDTTVVTPVDRVRWGPMLAGMFSALSTLLVLTLVGLAIGAASFNPGDRASGFGVGAGIWSAISLLLAFAVGGYVAARTAAVAGGRNGMINGALMWAVAIPLLLYALGSGVGALLGTAGSIAATGVTVAGQVASGAASNPDTVATAQAGAAVAPNAAATAQAGIANVQATAQALNTPQNQEAVADGVRNAALGALVPLLLSLGAAALGGYLGARKEMDTTTVHQAT